MIVTITLEDDVEEALKDYMKTERIADVQHAINEALAEFFGLFEEPDLDEEIEMEE